MDGCQLGHSLGLRGHRASTSLRWLGSSSLHRHHEAGSVFARHTLTYILHIPSLTQFSGRSLWVLFPTSLCGGIYFFCALPSAARLLRLPSVCSRPPRQLCLTQLSRTQRPFAWQGMAFGDIDITFVWRAWHLLTSTLLLCCRRGIHVAFVWQTWHFMAWMTTLSHQLCRT